MLEIFSTEDFVHQLDQMAETVIAADGTTFADPAVMASATKLAKALEGSMIDGRVVTGEFDAVVDP